jgi:hypothetical protein
MPGDLTPGACFAVSIISCYSLQPSLEEVDLPETLSLIHQTSESTRGRLEIHLGKKPGWSAYLRNALRLCNSETEHGAAALSMLVQCWFLQNRQIGSALIGAESGTNTSSKVGLNSAISTSPTRLQEAI